MSILSRQHNNIISLMEFHGEDHTVAFTVDELNFGGSNKVKFKDMFAYVESLGGSYTMEKSARSFTRVTYRNLTFTGPAWLMAEVSGYLADKVRNRSLV